ncbi:MAG: 50S ribosomal protein L25 [Elusimicrobia bacterium CG08_land_8_20_14_0_20_44_26]|nr:MAG: 50S ribosomal protein L25 [Elusimicrobia bacterium CG08_land_8_20_14_0_20_44_26]
METQIAVHGREAGKKSVLNRLRKERKIPAVIYGAKYNPKPVWVDEKEITKIISTAKTSIINLMEDQESITAIIKDVSYDVISDRPNHIDFMKIEAKKELELKIRVELAGESPGVKAGGILDFITREVIIRTIPSKIPKNLVLDISGVELGNVLKVSDIKVPEGVAVLTPSDTICVSVKAPRKEEEPAPSAEAAVAAQAEPEVVKKGKEVPKEEVVGEAAPEKKQDEKKADEKKTREKKGKEK